MIRWFSIDRSTLGGDATRRSAQRRRTRANFEMLAKELDELPDGPEKLAGYQRLAEARDWFLRAIEQ